MFLFTVRFGNVINVRTLSVNGSPFDLPRDRIIVYFSVLATNHKTEICFLTSGAFHELLYDALATPRLLDYERRDFILVALLDSIACLLTCPILSSSFFVDQRGLMLKLAQALFENTNTASIGGNFYHESSTVVRENTRSFPMKLPNPSLLLQEMSFWTTSLLSLFPSFLRQHVFPACLLRFTLLIGTCPQLSPT